MFNIRYDTLLLTNFLIDTKSRYESHILSSFYSNLSYYMSNFTIMGKIPVVRRLENQVGIYFECYVEGEVYLLMSIAKKVRRIDFSHEELEENLNLTKNAVNKRLDKVCDYYGFDKTNFKVGKDSEKYFFPVEYTGLLEILLATIVDNPSAKKRATEKVSAEDIVEFNKKLMKMITESNNIPESFKDSIRFTPAYKTAEKIVDNLLVLVDEVHLLLHTLFSSPGRDLGETLKLMNRYLDEVNYNLYANQLRDNSSNLYNKGAAALDIMLDESIARTIKLMMKRSNLDERQDEECEILLDEGEYLDVEDRKGIENEIIEKNPSFTKEEIIKEADKIEREQYFRENNVMLSFMAESTRNMMTLEVRTGKKWKTRYDMIKEGIFHVDPMREYEKSNFKGPYDEYMKVFGINFLVDEKLNTPKHYMEYLDKIRNGEKDIHSRISQRIAFDIIERFVHNKDIDE